MLSILSCFCCIPLTNTVLRLPGFCGWLKNNKSHLWQCIELSCHVCKHLLCALSPTPDLNLKHSVAPVVDFLWFQQWHSDVFVWGPGSCVALATLGSLFFVTLTSLTFVTLTSLTYTENSSNIPNIKSVTTFCKYMLGVALLLHPVVVQVWPWRAKRRSL